MRPIRNLLAEREWRQRSGRFALCDPDEPGRAQVMPGEPPDLAEQTHTYRDDTEWGYADGA